MFEHAIQFVFSRSPCFLNIILNQGTCPPSTYLAYTVFCLKFHVQCIALANGDAEGSLKQAEQVMKTVRDLTEKDIPNKVEFVASLHSCIGNAHLELGDSELALKHHLEDMKIAEEQ